MYLIFSCVSKIYVWAMLQVTINLETKGLSEILVVMNITNEFIIIKGPCYVFKRELRSVRIVLVWF
jgi:hypothetical protein